MKLNYPAYPFSIREENNSKEIFDELRKKFVALTPEEWVRQHLIKYLINEKKFPKSLIGIEYPLKTGNLVQRADVVIFHTDGNPILLAECKAPDVKISQKTFDQISAYNLSLHVPFLIITNGINHYCCKMDFDVKKFIFLPSIPSYPEIISGL